MVYTVNSHVFVQVHVHVMKLKRYSKQPKVGPERHGSPHIGQEHHASPHIRH